MIGKHNEPEHQQAKYQFRLNEIFVKTCAQYFNGFFFQFLSQNQPIIMYSLEINMLEQVVYFPSYFLQNYISYWKRNMQISLWTLVVVPIYKVDKWNQYIMQSYIITEQARSYLATNSLLGIIARPKGGLFIYHVKRIHFKMQGFGFLSAILDEAKLKAGYFCYGSAAVI